MFKLTLCGKKFMHTLKFNLVTRHILTDVHNVWDFLYCMGLSSAKRNLGISNNICCFKYVVCQVFYYLFIYFLAAFEFSDQSYTSYTYSHSVNCSMSVKLLFTTFIFCLISLLFSR